MKCKDCKKNFPDFLFVDFFHDGKWTRNQCPICVLKERNRIHGLPEDALFEGKEAHKLYLQAKKHIGEG